MWETAMSCGLKLFERLIGYLNHLLTDITHLVRDFIFWSLEQNDSCYTKKCYFLNTFVLHCANHVPVTFFYRRRQSLMEALFYGIAYARCNVVFDLSLLQYLRFKRRVLFSWRDDTQHSIQTELQYMYVQCTVHIICFFIYLNNTWMFINALRLFPVFPSISPPTWC